MKTYSILLFDADHTLLDFDATQQAALTNTFNQYGYPLDDEMKERYLEINKTLWDAYEAGLMTREEVVYTRFGQLFQEIGIQDDGIQFEKDYQSALGNGHELMDGAMEVIQALHQKFDLYIASNGVSATQYQRLDESNLRPYFKDVFVSEEIGYQKPKKEYFSTCFERIGHVELKEVLMIGDSLSSDMQGGLNIGIDTCWFNPHHVVNKEGLPITFEISDLKELYDIVGKDTSNE